MPLKSGANNTAIIWDAVKLIWKKVNHSVLKLGGVFYDVFKTTNLSLTQNWPPYKINAIEHFPKITKHKNLKGNKMQQMKQVEEILYIYIKSF